LSQPDTGLHPMNGMIWRFPIACCDCSMNVVVPPSSSVKSHAIRSPVSFLYCSHAGFSTFV
jgi:hypothetical protein